MRSIVSILVLSAATLSCQSQVVPLTPEESASISEEVLAVQTDLLQANERLDLSEFMEFIADDFIMAKEENVLTREVFQESLAADFPLYGRYVIGWEPQKVSVPARNVAIITASIDWIVIGIQADTVWRGPCSYTSVFELRNGSWKVTHGHLSWDEPSTSQ